jgi:hypothetical protein
MAAVLTPIIRAFEAGKLRLRHTSPRSDEPNHSEIVRAVRVGRQHKATWKCSSVHSITKAEGCYCNRTQAGQMATVLFPSTLVISALAPSAFAAGQVKCHPKPEGA